MDSLTSLADYKANGLVSVDGTIDYAAAKKMQESGTVKRDDTVLKAAPGRAIKSIKELENEQFQSKVGMSKGALAATAISSPAGMAYAGYKYGQYATRHQSGEDFVMADWTPAYLDYGERVLTASENAKYTAMGGVAGVEQRMTSGGGGASVPSKMELGLKVSPREMAHAITPYVIKELQADGKWEDLQ